MKRINDLQKYFRVGNRKDFDKLLLSIVPHLHPYIKHRLYVAENTGIIPKNMYCFNGIIDDAIVKIYESSDFIEDSLLDLELKLFKIADSLIDDIYTKEGWHQHNFSTSRILMDELDYLERSYTTGASNDFIMKEDLNDICYHQDIIKKQPFIYNDSDSEIYRVVASEANHDETKQRLLDKFYSWLPMNTSKIIDLFIFGKLNFEEIAKIRDISSQEVKETLVMVRKSFRRNLI